MKACHLTTLLVCIVLVSCSSTDEVSTNCIAPIEWDSLPSFNFPLDVIYEGPVITDGDFPPLNHGFSHIGWRSLSEDIAPTLAVDHRALVWTGLVNADGEGTNQPWKAIRSPWGNNLSVLESSWEKRAGFYARFFEDSSAVPNVDLVVMDVESHYEKVDDILDVRNSLQKMGQEVTSSTLPKNVLQLSDDGFVESYRREMTNLYRAPISLAERMNLPGRTSSYSDVPIRRTWHEIDDYSWREWTSNPSLHSYLTTNVEGDLVTRTEFYDSLEFLSPSAYFFYKYSRGANDAGRYLAYLLFQVEVNRAWSEKDIYLFAWLRFSRQQDYGDPIDKSMAESVAIFPFMAGAKGLWMWDDGKYRQPTCKYERAPYSHFVLALHRLSEYAHFFDDPDVYVSEHNPRDLFVTREPIWRGIVKDDKMLIAAQNPYARPGQKSTVQIEYQHVNESVELTGREVSLVEIEL